MATMSMNKVIHSAVRRDLDRFRRALDAFRDGDRERAAALHRAWQHFDAQLTEHHEGEHEIAWPGLKAVGIDVTTLEAFDTEHAAMAADLAATGTAMDRLSGSATRADAEAAAAAMQRLQATTTTHLEHEEEISEPVFAEHHDHPAIKEMGKKFSRSQSIGQAGGFMAWLEDGASPEERAALRANVPGPVVTILGGLFGRRYRTQIAPLWATPGSV